MHKSSLLLLTVLVAACSPDHPRAFADQSANCQPPFVGLEESQLPPEDLRVLKEASADFCAVLISGKPIYAKPEPGLYAAADGGSVRYIGRKYAITALDSVSSFGRFGGTARGPILKFDASFAPGNTDEISNVRVYGVPLPPPSPASGP